MHSILNSTRFRLLYSAALIAAWSDGGKLRVRRIRQAYEDARTAALRDLRRSTSLSHVAQAESGLPVC